jgi:hypothetical protein
MTAQQLAALTCDAVGSVVDWDTSHWDIARSQAVTDATLSCSEYHAPLAAMSTAVRGIGPTWRQTNVASEQRSPRPPGFTATSVTNSQNPIVVLILPLSILREHSCQM